MATYGLKITRKGEIVTDANMAQQIIINIFGGGSVEEFFAESGRWNVSVPRRIEDHIDCQGYQRALAKTVGDDATEWK
jgi:hypothetical protein